MKRQILSLLLVVFVITPWASTHAQASMQMDSVECLKNYSLYKEALKKKMYDYSIGAWRTMFNECPDVTIRLYSDGIDIYKHYIKKEKDALVKEALVDTLLMIYDQRMQYFGSHPKYPKGWVQGRKGIDIVTYRRDEIESLKQAVACFKASFNQLGNDTEAMVAVNWLQAVNVLVDQGELAEDELLSVYLDVDAVLAAHIARQKNDKAIEMLNKASDACTQILAQSGFSDCSTIQLALAENYELVKDNAAGLERMLNLLAALNCDGGDLYARAAERNYQLVPSAKASYLLAKYFIRQNKFDKAKDYYLKTISQADDEDLQAKCFYELAVVTFSHFKNSRDARTYAQNALEKKTDWGKPHILIGNIYAQESEHYGDSDFEHQTVYWVALDRFKKAMAIDPECTEEAQKQINLYSQYLPDKETGFFHGIQEGDQYTVGSWINEQTTVRYR
ncbi:MULTISPECIES: tetratricopeptide repeat protein [unclassified Carboxylicivirga]|uniref:tetratricopeptide repeat protein n=1 Tax=Carboxylicivirga TaxID=1628153 RepID=UPI003D32B2C5